jgi:hypothetical protein
MEEIAISPSPGEFGALDSLLHHFRGVGQGDQLPYHQGVVPQSQHRGSEQAWTFSIAPKMGELLDELLY